MKTLNLKIWMLPLITLFVHCGGTATQSGAWLNTGVKGLVSPASISVECVSSHNIEVTWDEFSTSASSIQIERSEDGENFDFIGDVEPNVTTYSDTSISYGTMYTYRVRSVITSETDANYVSNYVNSMAIIPTVTLCSTGPVGGGGGGGPAPGGDAAL